MPKSSNYEIKTTLAIDGEKKFKAAMEDANRAMGVHNADLRAMAAEYDYTNDKQRYFAQRAELISEKLKQQEAVVEALQRAVKESADMYGDAARQTDGYRIKLSNATAKLFDMRKEAEEANRELEKLGKTNPDMEFLKAMDEANRSMRLYQSEAKLLSVTYRNNGQDADYLAKKSQNLKEQIAAVEKIYIETAEAAKRSAAATGEMSEETVNLKIRTNEARITLTNLRRESEEADRELEKLGRDSGKIGRQIERGIGDAAEDTERKVKSMFEGLQEEVNAIRSNTTVSAFLDIGGAIGGAVSNLDAFAESSREYRRSMSFLEQNANLFGIEMSVAKDLFFQMASVTGEVDSSVEALSNLMAAGFDAEELAAAVDLLGGAVIRFPDTLKFESLADGLQETLATGEAAGQYAELLERMGVNLEEFNKQLDKAKTAEEDQQIALAYLTKNGLATAFQMYKDANGELLLAEEATLRLNDALSGFGTVIDKILAPGKMFAADVIGELATYANTAADSVGNWLYDRYQTNRNISEESINQKIEEGEKLTQMEARFSLAYKIRDWFKNLFPSAGAETIPTADLQDYGFKAAQEVATGMMHGMENNAAVDAAIKTALAEMSAQDVMDNAKLAGKNAMLAFGNGIAEGAGVPISNVQNMVNQINAMLSAMASPAYGLGWGGITGGNIALYMDGQKVGGLVAGGVSSALGRKVSTKMTMK